MTAEPTGLDAMRTDAVTAVTPAWAELSLSSHQAVCVAVLDGMVDMSHPCFSGAHLQLLGDPDEAPSEHGTHTASLIFGQPGTAVRGVAPSCRGLIIPTFRPVGGAAEGAGPTGQRLGCTQRDLAASIELAVERGAHIINISGGQIVDSTDEAAPELQAAVAHCDRVGTLIVAAAGNDGCDCLHVPAAMDPVLAVGAVDASGAPLGWSNFGHAYHANGVVAPGRAILGASVGGGVRAHDGTSCACAHVSGVAAVLVSLQHAQGQPLDPPAVRQAILSSVEPCDLHGTHDCRRALVGTIRPDHAAELIYSPSDLEPTAPQVPQAATGEEGMTDTRETKETTCSCGGGAAPSATSEVQQSSVSAAAPPSVTPSGRDEVPPATVPVSQSPGRRPWTGAPNGGGSQLVYFVGELGFNFASVTRLESFQQNMPAGTSTASDADVVAYLEANPWASSALIWTIGYESIPVYAVAPFAYEAQGYAHLLELMKRQLSGEAVRVSVPGLVDGRVDLLCGGSVPVIIPDLRGIRSWDKEDLVGAHDGDGSRLNFLNRVFFELRSPGLRTDDRAINFAATQGATTHDIFKGACDESLMLEKIDVEDSPICRPGSICRDVLLTFFDPKRRYERARRVYRLTVDVSDTVPSRIGELRTWDVY